MMEKDKLRKADLFSGGVIFLVGLFIVTQALGMPMKDSWGGVQNVWYVSPAIFPLFVGAMIMLLGLLLVRTALKAVGFKAVGEVLGIVLSPALKDILTQKANIRFFAILTLFFSFVFVMLPRVDFFLAAILFLCAFIAMFYLDDDAILVKLFAFFAFEMVCLIIFLIVIPDGITEYPGDWFLLGAIPAFIFYAGKMAKQHPETRTKFKLVLILSFAAPVLIGGAFKYLLLVPMPFEGMVVELMDMIWYFEF
ncbi:MAG: hypothetical protein MI892_07630 [Desulfobacterales bacterium]|nr:hypothetical protein [Desulfobacterales bacterium]